MYFFYLIVILSVTVIYSQHSIGDYCLIKSTKEEGKCVLLNHCQTAMTDLLNQKFPQTCGFVDKTPIVCCPKDSKIIDTPIDKPIINPSNNIPNKIVGEISRKKCQEYSKYTKVIVQSLLLDGMSIIQEKCYIYARELIVGGSRASVKEFPHMAMIGFANAIGDIEWLCSGSIISEFYVLTSAHCITSNMESGTDAYVKVGSIELDDHKNVQVLKMVEYITHPEFKVRLGYNDMGLVKLEHPIRFSTYVRPACLSIEPNKSLDRIISTSWSNLRDYNSFDLEKEYQKVVDNSVCNNSSIIQQFLKNKTNSENQLCISFTRNHELPQVEGLQQVFNEENYCMYEIVGVTVRNISAENISISTKISSYIKWIEGIVWP